MKKIALALTAVAAFTGSALAADMAPRTYSKAPYDCAVPTWTGCYISGGGGYGRGNHENTLHRRYGLSIPGSCDKLVAAAISAPFKAAATINSRLDLTISLWAQLVTMIFPALRATLL